MTTEATGFIVGLLAAAFVGVAVPGIPVLRGAVASALLMGAILTAAWYLP